MVLHHAKAGSVGWREARNPTKKSSQELSIVGKERKI
jgi:hypothetical protein